MTKRRSKKLASSEDQGLGSKEELKKNPHTFKELQEGNETTKPENKFRRKFTFKDAIKVLRALKKHGFKTATMDFYKKADLKLSFHATHKQVYEKVKDLKKSYLSRLESGSVRGLNTERVKLHDLCRKIWGMEGQEKEQEKRADEFKQKVDNFHRVISMYKEDDLNAECHVLEALQTAPIPLLERTGFINYWKELQRQQSQLLEEKRDLISRVTQAVETSPLGLP